jgi:hypothetical protein
LNRTGKNTSQYCTAHIGNIGLFSQKNKIGWYIKVQKIKNLPKKKKKNEPNPLLILSPLVFSFFLL